LCEVKDAAIKRIKRTLTDEDFLRKVAIDNACFGISFSA
jgi:hypothetical protein